MGFNSAFKGLNERKNLTPTKWASALDFMPIHLQVANLAAKRIMRPAFQLLSTSCCIYFLLGWVQFSTE